jgi:hypothetical protein
MLIVNDGVNPPVSSTVTLNVVPYLFINADTLVLARSNWGVVTEYTQEAHMVPATGPFIVVVNHPPVLGSQIFTDGGVNYTGGPSLTFVTTPPLTGQYNVDVNGDYTFALGDASAAIQITYSIEQKIPISGRNVAGVWPTLNKSAIYTNETEFKRSTDLDGESRFIVVSPASVLVYSDDELTAGTYLLRKLLIPDYDSGLVEDAVHTELDYTMVLTSTNNLYRYSVAPNINSDSPDTVLKLSNYVTLTTPIPLAWVASTAYTLGDQVLDSNGNVQIVVQNGVSGLTHPVWNLTRAGVTNDGPFLLWKNLGLPVIFDSLFSTATFDNVRVVALSGPSGCFLLQLNSTQFTVQGFFEISVESGLIYGADNVQWIRESNVESLHSGKVLLGTLDSQGRTYETLIDLAHRQVLGTWDASKLKNQFVTTGEILFETQSTYVGAPQAPVLSPAVVNSNFSVNLKWTTERPDLVSSYQIQMSTDGGGYNPLTYIGSGIIQAYVTSILPKGHTYTFQVRSGSPDGFSPFSNAVSASF